MYFTKAVRFADEKLLAFHPVRFIVWNACMFFAVSENNNQARLFQQIYRPFESVVASPPTNHPIPP